MSAPKREEKKKGPTREIKSDDFSVVKPIDADEEIPRDKTPESKEKSGESKRSITALSKEKKETKWDKEPPSESKQQPFVGEFPRELDELISSFVDIDTLEEQGEVDTSTKEFDREPELRKYQREAKARLPKRWQQEIQDLRKLLFDKDKLNLVATDSKDIESATYNRATYEALAKKYEPTLYQEIYNYLDGKSTHSSETILECIGHYCRIPNNKSGVLLTFTLSSSHLTPTLREQMAGYLIEGGAVQNKTRYKNSTPLMSALNPLCSLELFRRIVKEVPNLEEESPDLFVGTDYEYLKRNIRYWPQSWSLGVWSPLVDICYYYTMAWSARMAKITLLIERDPSVLKGALNTLLRVLNYAQSNKGSNIALAQQWKDKSWLCFTQPLKVESYAKTALIHLLFGSILAKKSLSFNATLFSILKEVTLTQKNFENLIYDYRALINSLFLNPPQKGLFGGRGKSPQTEYIETWRERAFKLLQEKEHTLSPEAFEKECRDLWSHDGFSRKYEQVKHGVNPEYRERLEAVWKGVREKLQGTPPDFPPVVSKT